MTNAIKITVVECQRKARRYKENETRKKDLHKSRVLLDGENLCQKCEKAPPIKPYKLCARCLESRREFANFKKRKDYTIALQSVYGMELQADIVEITINNIIKLCEQTFKTTKAEKEIINDHIIQADSLKVMKMINDKNLKQEEGDNA
jgi:hypothetical protein